MELRDYLAILRAHFVAIIALTVVGAVTAFGWTLLQQKVYTADSSGFITAGTSNSLAEASVGDSYAKSRAQSYIDVAKSRTVADHVIAQLHLATTAESLVNQISVTNPLDTVLIKVSATAESPEAAGRLANAWLSGVVAQVADLENGDDVGQTDPFGNTIEASVVRLVPIDSAVIPTEPSSPNVRLVVALGALIGLALGIGYAVTRHVLDRRVRTGERLEAETGLAVIGSVPVDRRLADGDRLGANSLSAMRKNVNGKDAAVTEAFRQLRTNLRYMDIDSPPRVITITSALPGEGKSTVAANLALAIAAGGEQVFLVDGDLRRPSIADAFGLLNDVGLTDVLIGRTALADVLQPGGFDGALQILASGKVPPNPTELLGSRSLRGVLQALSARGIVIVDAPPLLPVTDAAVLAANTHGAIVVASSRRVTYDQVQKALGHLERVNARSLGLIVNRVARRGPDRSDYYQYTYSSAGVER